MRTSSEEQHNIPCLSRDKNQIFVKYDLKLLVDACFPGLLKSRSYVGVVEEA